jgi:hypothetical protein
MTQPAHLATPKAWAEPIRAAAALGYPVKHVADGQSDCGILRAVGLKKLGKARLMHAHVKADSTLAPVWWDPTRCETPTCRP